MPKRLTDFLARLCCDDPDIFENDSNKAIKICSIAQDLVSISTNGRQQMPKCVAIALALKTTLNSKEFIDICNKNSHCISYNTVSRVEANWADNIIKQNKGYSVIPNNITSCKFTEAVADNSDYGQENNSQHITNTILLQCVKKYDFDRDVVANVKKKHTDNDKLHWSPFRLLNIELSKKTKLPHHFSQININSILPSTKSFAREMMSCINTSWILTRSLPTLTMEIPVQKFQVGLEFMY